MRKLNITHRILKMFSESFSLCQASAASVIYGYKGYTELHLGNVNILISVPHDGLAKPREIQNRQNDHHGNFKNDHNTRKIAKIINDQLTYLFFVKKNLRIQPFIIINNLHRVKMDPNRELSGCCFSANEESAIAYNDYHSLIENYFCINFMKNGVKNFKQALLIDLHGQTHEENWIELGYLLPAAKLDKELLKKNAKKSSIQILANESSFKFESLIRGVNVSLGGIMEKKFNLRVVPSPNNPSPNCSNYYSGGYITERYTSLDFLKYRINSIQIELPASMRDEATYEIYAKQIAECVFDFYYLHSFDSLIQE